MLICIALDLLIRILIRIRVHGVVLWRSKWVRKSLYLDWILVIIVLADIRHASAAFGIIINLDKILVNIRFCGVRGVRKYTSKRPRSWYVTDVGGRYVKVFGDDFGFDWGFDHEGRLRKAWEVGDTWRQIGQGHWWLDILVDWDYGRGGFYFHSWHSFNCELLSHRTVLRDNVCVWGIFWHESTCLDWVLVILNTQRFQRTNPDPSVQYCRIRVNRLLLSHGFLGDTSSAWQPHWDFHITLWESCWLWRLGYVVFMIEVDTNGFRMPNDVTFPSFADKRFVSVVSNHIILEFYPFRPRSGIFAQHIIEHVGKFFRVAFPESVLIVLQSLNMNTGILVSITLVLVLKQSAL